MSRTYSGDLQTRVGSALKRACNKMYKQQRSAGHYKYDVTHHCIIQAVPHEVLSRDHALHSIHLINNDEVAHAQGAEQDVGALHREAVRHLSREGMFEICFVPARKNDFTHTRAQEHAVVKVSLWVDFFSSLILKLYPVDFLP